MRELGTFTVPNGLYLRDIQSDTPLSSYFLARSAFGIGISFWLDTMGRRRT